MKRILFMLASAFAMTALPGAFAAELKIAHVDSKLIFEGYAETKKAQSEYDKKVAKWEQEAADMQKDLVEMQERLEKQSLMLSEEKKKELEADFLKKKAEYQQFVSKIYGKDGRLFNENEKHSGPIIQKIKKTIQDVANQEGYDMVIDRAAGAVVFWKKDNDLTDRVLDFLNKEAK